MASTPTTADVEEIKATHMPLMSAAFFLNEHCKDYSDVFMYCKRENAGAPEPCLSEGRKLTRCSLDLLQKLESACGSEFKDHWQCLEMNNNYYWKCRQQETRLNRCAFDKLGLRKRIPGAPDSQIPIHMRSDSERIYK